MWREGEKSFERSHPIESDGFETDRRRFAKRGCFERERTSFQERDQVHSFERGLRRTEREKDRQRAREIASERTLVGAFRGRSFRERGRETKERACTTYQRTENLSRVELLHYVSDLNTTTQRQLLIAPSREDLALQTQPVWRFFGLRSHLSQNTVAWSIFRR